jgi:hypothetical protein
MEKAEITYLSQVQDLTIERLSNSHLPLNWNTFIGTQSVKQLILNIGDIKKLRNLI